MSTTHVKIAVLGPRATFGHGVAKKLITQFGINAEIVFYPSNFQVCKNLADGNADLAIVPIENNSPGAGLVPDWLNWCAYESVMPGAPRAEIIYEKIADVKQCLMVKLGVKFEDVKVIYSHERALRQCRDTIFESGAEEKETKSTAAAAELVSSSDASQGFAVLADQVAAKEYGLEIIRQNAEDNPGNVTRFGILRLKKSSVSGAIEDIEKPTNTKRLIVRFSLPNIVGSLHGVTSLFVKLNANMTSLRDLPQGLPRSFVYGFYVEYEIDVSKADESIEALKQVTENLFVYGNFFVEDKGQ